MAAACVTVACLFKGYPLAVGLLLAAVYPRPFAPRLVLALAAGLALPLLVQRPDYVAQAYRDWLWVLGADDRMGLPVGRILTGDAVAEEILRTLIGAIGLVAAVPITTLLAAFLAVLGDRATGCSGQASWRRRRRD